MVSLETRAIVGSALSVLLAFTLAALVDFTVGFPDEWSTLASFLIVVGLGIGAPQLYLAYADRSVSATSRFGLVLIVLVLFGGAAAQTATRREQIAILALTGLFVLAVGVYQIRAGYRQSMGGVDSADRS